MVQYLRMASRPEIAARYRDLLAGCPVRHPEVRSGCEPVHHVYPIRAERRDALREHLAREGVDTGIHYAVPAHAQPALAGRPHRCGPLAVTEQVCSELLSLPMYPELSDAQIETVTAAVHGFFTAERRSVGGGRA